MNVLVPHFETVEMPEGLAERLRQRVLEEIERLRNGQGDLSDVETLEDEPGYSEGRCFPR